MFVPLYIVYCPIFKCFLFLTSKENYTFCILLLLYYFSRTFLRHLNVVATKCYSFTFTCVLQVMYNIYHIKYSKDRLQDILLPYFLYLFMLVVLEKLLEILSYISEFHVQEFSRFYSQVWDFYFVYTHLSLLGNAKSFPVV